MKNGEMVRRFEEALAEYCGARFAICLANGTATIHTALAVTGVKPGYGVVTSPLTMSATSIAILQAGGVPEYHDVNPDTWLVMEPDEGAARILSVSLYGLHCGPYGDEDTIWIDDAAQTLRPHNPNAKFTSLSFQSSKVLALGEGGALLTNDEELATRAREFSSLGYKMAADQPRINPATLKHPSFERHHTYPAWNYRMSDVVAGAGLTRLWRMHKPHNPLERRRHAASLYREAISGCDWIKPQHVPEGWTCDYWAFAVALESAELWEPFVASIERHGGERPYAAWRLTYQEPAFRHLAVGGCCPVAESLQPRLVQFQTNGHYANAARNGEALRMAIREIGGSR